MWLNTKEKIFFICAALGDNKLLRALFFWVNLYINQQRLDAVSNHSLSKLYTHFDRWSFGRKNVDHWELRILLHRFEISMLLIVSRQPKILAFPWWIFDLLERIFD